MEVEEAIHTRSSVGKVLPDRPDRPTIEALLDAAVRAPTHHLTEPWRFIVLAGSALDDLGEAMTIRVRETASPDEDLEQRLEVERARPHRAPVIIVVVYVPSTNPRAIEVEDRYSIGAAMQNILLAAHGRGLGAFLRTGPASRHRAVLDHLGLAPAEEVAGFIYVGIPSGAEVTRSRRTEASVITDWRGWDEPIDGSHHFVG